MTRLRLVAAGALLAGLSGCTDPAPDAAYVEAPQSVYHPQARSPSTLATPIEIVPDKPFACGDAPDGAIAATVYWNARTPKAPTVEIHVRPADQPPASAKLWTRVSPIGSLRAPSWLRQDTQFELRETTTQRVIASASVTCN